MSLFRKKRHLLTVLSICGVFFLAGCGDSKSDEANKATTNVTTPATQPKPQVQQKQSNPARKSFGINEDMLPNDIPTSIDTNVDTAKASNVTMHFLNTGDSDTAIIVEGKTAMLIDGGDLDDGVNTVKYLQDLGIKTIKYLVISHGHKDNVEGLPAIIDAFTVDYIFAPDDYLGYLEYSETFKAYMDTKRLITFLPVEGLPYKLGKTYFQVYNTSKTDNIDDSSLAVVYSNGKTKALFMGDASETTEARLTPILPEVTLLKVSNHGLDTGTKPTFLDKVKPKYAVILGQNLDSTIVTERLKGLNVPVFKTSNSGNVVFESDGDELKTTNQITE